MIYIFYFKEIFQENNVVLKGESKIEYRRFVWVWKEKRIRQKIKYESV